MNKIKSTPLAQRFQKRMLGFILVLIIMMLVGGLYMSEYILAGNLRKNAEAMNELVQLQMNWMNLNSAAPAQSTPAPEEGTAETATTTEPSSPVSEGEHIPQMIVEEWGKTSTLGKDAHFGLVSLNPTTDKKMAGGKAKAFLEEMESGTQPIGNRWWKETGTYYLLSPLKNQESCTECHDDGDAKLRGAFLWEFGTASISKIRTMGIIASMIMVLGSVTILYLLFRRFFSQAITQPLGELETLADEISHGNFDARFNYDYDDEIKQVGESINRLKKSLQLAMKRLNG